MADAETPGRPPLEWRRLLPLALAVGVGPAIGRDVGTALQESWGFWPAKLAGVGAAAFGALVAYGVVWLVVHRRRTTPLSGPPLSGR